MQRTAISVGKHLIILNVVDKTAPSQAGACGWHWLVLCCSGLSAHVVTLGDFVPCGGAGRARRGVVK